MIFLKRESADSKPTLMTFCVFWLVYYDVIILWIFMFFFLLWLCCGSLMSFTSSIFKEINFAWKTIKKGIFMFKTTLRIKFITTHFFLAELKEFEISGFKSLEMEI
jgi:hypothetical protein